MPNSHILRHSHLLSPGLPYLDHLLIFGLLELRYFNIRIPALLGKLIFLDGLINTFHGGVFLLYILVEKEVHLLKAADLFERWKFSLRFIEQWSSVLAFYNGSVVLVAGCEIIFSSIDICYLNCFKQTYTDKFFLRKGLDCSQSYLWRKLRIYSHPGLLILRNRTSHNNGTILILLLYNNCQVIHE